MGYEVNWSRVQLKTDAKVVFRRNYGACVLAGFILTLLSGVLGVVRQAEKGDFSMNLAWGLLLSVGLIAVVLGVFVYNVFTVGGCRFFIENRDYKAPVSKLLFGFQGGHYGNVVWVMFLMNLKIFLWTLLLIIPGIIKGYEYMMVPYILAEQPDIDQADAFAISRQMMMNQKFEAFALDVSFLGWMLLDIFTCGLVGIFWYMPYYYATETELYVVLRNAWMQTQNPICEEPMQGENL